MKYFLKNREIVRKKCLLFESSLLYHAHYVSEKNHSNVNKYKGG